MKVSVILWSQLALGERGGSEELGRVRRGRRGRAGRARCRQYRCAAALLGASRTARASSAAPRATCAASCAPSPGNS